MARSREQERAQLLPTKEALTALKSDVTLESAILELCDNALDAWKRASDRREEAEIEISVTELDTRTELVIQDNTGGVPREEAAMLFGLGQTAKQNGGSIGTFGVGAKKSLVNLGVPFTIRSHHPADSEGWRYRIDEEWFEDDHDWSVPLHTDAKISSGVTEICIEDLNYDWSESTAETLRQRLGEAYNLFLSEKMQALSGEEYDLSITVDGEPVTAEGTPDWAFSPFDGLYPRRFESIKLTFEHLTAPIYVDITVGLLHKKDTHAAGTDIYMQKRKVVSNARDEQGGFGDGQERLGKFNARHDRLRIIIEIETEADGQELPWDTQKSSIDKHNLIMRGTDDTRGVYNWLRRVAQAYYELDADKVPRAFLEPYEADSPVATNDGAVKTYDYSDRQRIVSDHRPDTDLPEINAVRRKAEAHVTLRIRCDDSVPEIKQPAYRTQLSQESDCKIEELAQVNEAPPAEVEAQAHDVAGRINELARIHLENGVRYPAELEDWEQPRYEQYQNNHGGGDLSTVKTLPEDLPRSTEDVAKENYASLSTDHAGPVAESSQTISEDKSQSEVAELFLVFSDEETNEERGAKIYETQRSQLCANIDLSHNAGDDLVWEEVRQLAETTFD